MFSLPDTEGKLHSPGDATATVVVFTANHCPYALGWHDRIIDAARDYAGKDVKFLAISPNDAERYPADAPLANAERVAKGEFGDVPYLYDEDQSVARSLDAKTTPDIFVFDNELELRYRGAPDADYKDPVQNAAWLRGALDAVLAGKQPDPSETEPVGCSIKWK
ncbi:MAG TPA: thioredoxin family protein [Baekduia sp.]|nr:thioredoxin family protein [Baekduia sp.]